MVLFTVPISICVLLPGQEANLELQVSAVNALSAVAVETFANAPCASGTVAMINASVIPALLHAMGNYKTDHR